MSRVKTRDTAPEMTLRRALWAAGLRGWRLHPRQVPGRPDLAWIGRQIAVFVDGAFWHGHPDYYWGQSGKFWDEKIGRNRNRDVKVNRELRDAGWTVLRFWDFEVDRDEESCVRAVGAALKRERSDGGGRGEPTGRER
jgi:DNA mismatch endonuclease (patch repair protein)